jgi:FkbM family methyltransferase
MDNTEFVTCAYRLLLQREPDPDGEQTWHKLLDSGLTRNALVKGFLGSKEYNSRFDRIIETSVSTGGVSFRIGSREGDIAVGHAIQEGGEHEHWVTPHFLASIKPNSTVVDIGANLGWYSMLAAAKTLNGGRVVAFEPLPDNVQLLLANVRLNDFKHVTCYPVALGEHSDVLRIETGFGSNAAIARDGDVCGLFCQVLSARVALNEIGRFDVLKIDVEGYEPIVFKSAHEILHRERPTMFVEYHPWAVQWRGLDVAEFHEQLFSYGMSVRVMLYDHSTRLVHNAAELTAEHARMNDEAKQDGRMHLDLLLTPG